MPATRKSLPPFFFAVSFSGENFEDYVVLDFFILKFQLAEQLFNKSFNNQFVPILT